MTARRGRLPGRRREPRASLPPPWPWWARARRSSRGGRRARPARACRRDDRDPLRLRLAHQAVRRDPGPGARRRGRRCRSARRIGDVWPGRTRGWPAGRSPTCSATARGSRRGRRSITAAGPLEEVEELLAAGGRDGDLVGARAGTYSDLGLYPLGSDGGAADGRSRSRSCSARACSPRSASPAVESRRGTGRTRRVPHGHGQGNGARGAAGVRRRRTSGRRPLGRPQDGNGRSPGARARHGGVSGHAGLFGGARDLWRLAAEWLEPGRLLKPEGVAAALSGGGPFALGWWRQDAPRQRRAGALAHRFRSHRFCRQQLLDRSRSGGRIYVLLASRIDPAMRHQPLAPALPHGGGRAGCATFE